MNNDELENWLKDKIEKYGSMYASIPNLNNSPFVSNYELGRYDSYVEIKELLEK